MVALPVDRFEPFDAGYGTKLAFAVSLSPIGPRGGKDRRARRREAFQYVKGVNQADKDVQVLVEVLYLRITA